jgi:hypothetical protein
VLVLFLLAACGGKGAIFLTIDARGPNGSLQIPADADKVSVKVTTSPDGVSLLEKDYPLEAGTHRFPLTLALEQGSKTGKRVKIEVNVYLGDTVRGYGTTTVVIIPEEVNEVTLRIDVP